MGWIMLFDPEFGLVNQVWMWLFDTDKGPFNIYTFWGIIFAHLAARSVAAKYIFLAPAFRNLDASMEEASRVSGANPLTTVMRIVVPVLMPALLITLCISVIHSLESFEIELILGPPTSFYVFSTKIYQLIAEDPPMFGAATVLGLAILGSMLPLDFWQQASVPTPAATSPLPAISRPTSCALAAGARRSSPRSARSAASSPSYR